MDLQAIDRLVKNDESAFVCFYICAHYNALRLSSTPLIDWSDDDHEAYIARLRSMLHDLQIDDRYKEVAHLAWQYAQLVGKQVKVDMSCVQESKTRKLDRIKQDGKVVHLVTGKKFQLLLDGKVKRTVTIKEYKYAIPLEWTNVVRIEPNNRTLTFQVCCGRITGKDIGADCTQGPEPFVSRQIVLVNCGIFDRTVDLSSEVFPYNGLYIKLRNQMSFRAQLKIDSPLQVAPQFWVIKIPNMLLKRSSEACCDPHRKSVGPPFSCVRSCSIESHWKQVLGPIFIISATQWYTVPKLAQPVLISLSRLSFLLSPGELQKDLSAILVSYVDATMPRMELSERQRNDYCLDEPQMVELVTRNLLAYDSHLDVRTKTDFLEWICDRMKMVNVSSVYFTASLLQYLHYLARGIDRSQLADKQVDLLCKVAKLTEWIGKMLDEEPNGLKQLVEDEQEEEDWADEEEEQEGEDTQEMSDSDVESHSEVSESSQDQTEVEAQDETISVANEPNQSVPPFSPTAHLRTMARKLKRKCSQLMDELNNEDDHHH